MAQRCGLGKVLADTGEVMDEKEKKELNVEIMKNKFAAVENMKTILMSLSIPICVVVIYKPSRQHL